MKTRTLLAAALLSLPLVALAGDGKAPPADKNTSTTTKSGDKAADKSTKASDTKGKAKPATEKPATKKPATKADEKPCEPVKPCSID